MLHGVDSVWGPGDIAELCRGTVVRSINGNTMVVTITIHHQFDYLSINVDISVFGIMPIIMSGAQVTSRSLAAKGPTPTASTPRPQH